MNIERKPIIVPRYSQCPFKNSFGYVYCIVNLQNNHKYIGKHVYEHPYIDCNYWASGGKHLQGALEKYGKDLFEYSILEWVEYSEDFTREYLGILLSELEKYYIDLLGTFVNLEDYNETPGGDSWECGENNPMYNNHRFAGKNHPMYGVLGENNPRFGQKHSEESKKKMRKSRPNIKGNNNPMYNVRKFGENNPFYSKHHSDETKQKISNANKGKGYLRLGKNNPMYGKTGEKHPRAVQVVRLNFDYKLVKVYSSFSEAVSEGFNSSAISDCCRGKSKTHRGFKWMYKKDYENMNIKEVTLNGC